MTWLSFSPQFLPFMCLSITGPFSSFSYFSLAPLPLPLFIFYFFYLFASLATQLFSLLTFSFSPLLAFHPCFSVSIICCIESCNRSLICKDNSFCIHLQLNVISNFEPNLYFPSMLYCMSQQKVLFSFGHNITFVFYWHTALGFNIWNS